MCEKGSEGGGYETKIVGLVIIVIRKYVVCIGSFNFCIEIKRICIESDMEPYIDICLFVVFLLARLIGTLVCIIYLYELIQCSNWLREVGGAEYLFFLKIF